MVKHEAHATAPMLPIDRTRVFVDSMPFPSMVSSAEDLEPLGTAIAPLCFKGEQASVRARTIVAVMREQAATRRVIALAMGGLDVIVHCDGYALAVACMSEDRMAGVTAYAWCPCGCDQWRGCEAPPRKLYTSDAFPAFARASFDCITEPWRSEMPGVLDVYTARVTFNSAGKRIDRRPANEV
jgi:hypothetical protein